MEGNLAYEIHLVLTCYGSCTFLFDFIGCGFSWNPVLRDLFTGLPGCFTGLFSGQFLGLFSGKLWKSVN